MPSRRVACFATAVGAGLGLATSLHAVPVILPNVPDFFQHQGLQFNPEPYVSGGFFNWERGGGWCRATGLADSLYSLRARGYGNILPFFNNANPWRKQMSDSIFALRGIPAGGNPVATYLAGRGYSQFNGPNGQGLLVRQYVTDGQSNTYIMSAYGRLMPTGQKALSLYATAIARGDAINVKLGAVPGTVNPAVWWAGSFHYLSGVGVDLATRTMYLADPDSNKGSLLANAGWNFTQNDVPIQGRVYNAADAFPVGPGAPGPGFADYYGAMQVGPGNAQAVITGNDGGDNRYANTFITGFETITPVRVGRVRRAPVDGVGTSPPPVVSDFTLNFEDDEGSSDYIDKIMVLPVNALPELTFDDSVIDDDAWSDVDMPANFVDPLGETREYGGTEFDVIPNVDADIDGLEANESLALAIGTDLDFSSYDVLLHDAFTNEWMLEPIGAPEMDIGDQAPEPSSLALIGLGSLAMIRRRR